MSAVTIINPSTKSFIGEATVLESSYGWTALKSKAGIVRYFNLTTGLSIPAGKLKIEDKDLELLRQIAGYYCERFTNE